MVISSRFLTHRIWQKFQNVKTLNRKVNAFSSIKQTSSNQTKNENTSPQKQEVKHTFNPEQDLLKYRFIYPEFLPDPDQSYRNALRERLERSDMLARRSKIALPEFYVGSILAVVYSEPHAPGKVNKFVGICIERQGCGLRASCLLRNVIGGEAIEMRFDLYDPAIQKIDCLKLEKRLDDELIYLRDAPLEYSTFPFDMEKEVLPEGTPVPVNDIKVPLQPPPWFQKWELKNLKGVQNFKVSERRQKKAAANAKPWEKYDLMKTYRETIPEEEQNEIFAELQTELHQLQIKEIVLKRKRTFVRPKKAV